jgi:hypothetical protein
MITPRTIWRGSGTSALAIGLLAATAVAIQAQDLAHRSRLELQLGVGIRASTSATTSSGGVVTETSAAGFLGSFGYSYWLQEELALTIGLGVLTSDVESSVGAGGVGSRTATVVPLFAGLRYYFPRSTYGGKWRPYAAGAVGPVFGTETASAVGSVIRNESITRTALGGRLGAGLDVQLSRLIMLGLQAGYHLMTDFSDPIGGHENHSGPDFGISISVLLGRGVGDGG